MSIYSLPVIFSDDWIDSHWSKSIVVDDYRFAYLGTKGTWTPYHCDVFRSYSWSTNITGRKLWFFFPPKDAFKLQDRNGNTVYDVTGQVDTRKFPHFSSAKPITCIQESGETIFVPSGWWHQVHNLDDTISLNHNWANGCNVDIIWDYLKHQLVTVEKAISHLKSSFSTNLEWSEQCQLLLKANSGINFSGFSKFLSDMAVTQLDWLMCILGCGARDYDIVVERVFVLLEDILLYNSASDRGGEGGGSRGTSGSGGSGSAVRGTGGNRDSGSGSGSGGSSCDGCCQSDGCGLDKENIFLAIFNLLSIHAVMVDLFSLCKFTIKPDDVPTVEPSSSNPSTFPFFVKFVFLHVIAMVNYVREKGGEEGGEEGGKEGG
eukprot:TRINITY_DN4497_c0_g1_i2.p1 TRINITY_DN4497_c0_g1~~TRINITY_DN4497_c0_g1_i2.p1  ORF type:complete len:375 (-),score=91.84 TRINITY_DN4497_c0_g1_i2:133-1257(-)